MNLALPSRRISLIAGTVLLVTGLFIGIPWLSATRGVERAWDATIQALADNDIEAFKEHLDVNYHDGFGLDREGATALAKTIRGQFVLCTIRREQSELVLDPGKQSATSRAVMRLGGQGSPVATAVIQASAASNSPTLFRWRRASWKPWDWKLAAVDNADAAKGINQLERELPAAGLSFP